jgi:cytoplasmic iron level regulating protein YaaA (DUF328/UPF0246 family)
VVLIIVPSSETKRLPPTRGKPVALDALSFPELADVRASVLDALIQTSVRPDALSRLLVGPSFLDEVDRNTRLRQLPARPVLEVYAGTLHGGLDAATLSPAARRRASTRLVVASALWGLLRPADRIPPYRMNICARLDGIEHLEPLWRTVLPSVLAAAAGRRGVIFDVRAASYQALGMPAGFADRMVTLHVDTAAGGRVGNVFTKRVRGEAARFLLESGEDPRNPTELAALLAQRWPTRLEEPVRPGRPWSVTLSLPL